MKQIRPFRFGVQIATARPAGEWKERARRAEALGYDILVMPDHFGDQFAIGPALASVADATSLRIGTLVLQNDLRHPVAVAKEAATLDVLSGGRFELGIGAGGSEREDYLRTGISFDPPSTRVSRLDESLQLIAGLLAENPLTFHGRYYQLSDLDGQPKPIQRPHPPLLIGGGGPRMLRLAAQHADIINIFPTLQLGGGRFHDEENTTDVVAKKVEFVRQVAGDRFPQLELNALVQYVMVTDNRQYEVEQVSKRRRQPPEKWLDSPYVYIGSVRQIADEVRRCRQDLGISYYTVFEWHMEMFAPVVAELSKK